MGAYAVVRCAGHQYVVRQGQRVRVDRLQAEVGTVIELKEVLMMCEDGAVRVGGDLPSLRVRVVAHDRDRRIEVFRFKSKKHFRLRQGHRRLVTDIEVVGFPVGALGSADPASVKTAGTRVRAVRKRAVKAE